MAASPLKRRPCIGARLSSYENGRPWRPLPDSMMASLAAADAHRAPDPPVAVPDLPAPGDAAGGHISRTVIGVGKIAPAGTIDPVGARGAIGAIGTVGAIGAVGPARRPVVLNRH